MRDFNPLSFYDDYATEIRIHYGLQAQFPPNPGFKEFLDVLPEGGRVLDVGCGFGIDMETAIQRGFKATGIDFSERMLDYAKHRGIAGEFRHGDLSDPESYAGLEGLDGVYSCCALTLLPVKVWARTFDLMTAALKPGGHFFLMLAVDNYRGSLDRTCLLGDSSYRVESYFPTPKDVMLFFRNAGLTRQRFKPEGQTNCGISPNRRNWETPYLILGRKPVEAKALGS